MSIFNEINEACRSVFPFQLMALLHITRLQHLNLFSPSILFYFLISLKMNWVQVVLVDYLFVHAPPLRIICVCSAPPKFWDKADWIFFFCICTINPTDPWLLIAYLVFSWNLTYFWTQTYLVTVNQNCLTDVLLL